MQQRSWYRKLYYFYKTSKEQPPKYLFRHIPKDNTRYAMRNSKGIPQCKINHEYFKNFLFPRNIKERNMLDSDIRSSESLNVFKSKILKFIRPKANLFFNCLNPERVKLITRLRLGVSHIQGHKFKHSFQTVWAHYAAVVLKSKQLLIFTVSTTYMKEKSFWTTSNLSFLIFWNKVTFLLIMFFSLVIRL